MATWLRRWLRETGFLLGGAGVLLSLLHWGAGNSHACPFCSNMGKTLAENVAEAQVVLFGKLSNSKLNENAKAGEPEGSTDLEILKVIKDHPILAGQTAVVLPRFIPAAQKESVEYIIFAEVVEGKIDPYRGMPVDSKEFVDYLAGAVKVGAAKPGEKLAFFFPYLDDEDPNVSGDAYKEFANAPYADVVAAAKSYDADKLISWIQSKETPGYRIGLYGCLLGTCGRASDAPVLRSIIDSPDSRPITGVDGLMGGYCILDPEHGPDYVLNMLCDSKNDFNLRYAALRTVRFLLTEMPGADRKAIFARMAAGIEVPDMSDLVIDEFRKNKVWDPADKVLGLYGKPEFDLQVIRRAIIRFALKCPQPETQAFVAKLREKDPQLVADVEEILRFEEANYPPTPSAPASAPAAPATPAGS